MWIRSEKCLPAPCLPSAARGLYVCFTRASLISFQNRPRACEAACGGQHGPAFLPAGSAGWGHGGRSAAAPGDVPAIVFCPSRFPRPKHVIAPTARLGERCPTRGKALGRYVTGRKRPQNCSRARTSGQGAPHPVRPPGHPASASGAAAGHSPHSEAAQNRAKAGFAGRAGRPGDWPMLRLGMQSAKPQPDRDSGCSQEPNRIRGHPIWNLDPVDKFS